MLFGMELRLRGRSLCPLAGGCLALVLAAAPAMAHAVLEPKTAPAGAYHKLVIRIAHGCQGAPTTEVSVELPESVGGGRPQPKPGWRIAIEREPLQRPVTDGHGRRLTERVARIVWSGGPLDDAHFDEFALQLRLPDRPGATIRFPVVQRCGSSELRWTEVPPPGRGAEGLRFPAPSLLLGPRP